MKIALYYPWIYLKSGVERTILETVNKSKHEYAIFTNHYDKNGTYPEFKKLKVIELKRIPIRRNIFSVIRASIIIICQKIDLAKFDLFLIHSEGIGDLILFRNNKISAICFCHTPLRPVFDQDYKTRAREKRSAVKKIIYRIMDSVFQLVDRYLWRKYKYIIFNSMESLKRAKNGGLIGNNSDYDIIHPGINWVNIKQSKKFEKYFLVPGRIMWTKNIELAIESFLKFEKLYSVRDKFKLVIAGQVDTKSRSYFQKLKLLASKSRNIFFVVNPTDKKMSELYANCYAVLTTSFNEDWGITPVEANAHGKPVLAINKGGFKESQVNGKTGYLLNNNANEFAHKMAALAKNENLTQKLGTLARIHSKQFDWKIFINKFDHILSAQ